MRLAARGLLHTYGGIRVLDRVDLDFEPARVHILLGPNGSGKTTCLRLLNLIERPKGGVVLVDGRPVSSAGYRVQTACRRRMGFVFQAPTLLDGTVCFNLEHPLRIQGRPVDPVRIEGVLSQVGLEGKAGQGARQLSGGEKQRLQLARVMVLDPELYLLDEPTSSLDPLSARAVEQIIAGIVALGKTVILSTHNLLQARAIGDRFYFFNGGRLVQQGDGDSLFDRPLSIDIAEYSGSGNVVEGVLLRHNRGRRFVSGRLQLEVTSNLEEGPASVLIRPEEILLSKSSLVSSARNSLLGEVVSVRSMGLVQAVTLDVAGVELTAFITRESLLELSPQLGGALWLTVKSSSVHVMRG